MKAFKRIIRHLASFFPTQLPLGATAQAAWANDIIDLAGPAIPNNGSTQFALAVMVLHLGSTQASKPKRFFVLQLRKAAANEVSHTTAQQYKAQRDKETEDAKNAVV